jgi:hypothetical protein
MKLSIDVANQIYDILIEIGASEIYRKAFIWTHTQDENQVEWRFQGKLRFGGKFWNEWSYLEEKPKWRISCYFEDETPKRLKLIEETNEKLRTLANTLYENV